MEFTVRPAQVDENLSADETPEEHVRRLARAKAERIATRYPGHIVLGADTIVVRDGVIFGKPSSHSEARQVLNSLSGQPHEVITGVCLLRLTPGHIDVWTCRTRVHFKALDAGQIERYCQLVNTLDKAGAYAIQEHGDMLISRIEGLRSNVIGLPIEEVVERLARLA